MLKFDYSEKLETVLDRTLDCQYWYSLQFILHLRATHWVIVTLSGGVTHTFTLAGNTVSMWNAEYVDQLVRDLLEGTAVPLKATTCSPPAS